jgi:pimeloyl-ACP methyl ester carboxylesterase
VVTAVAPTFSDDVRLVRYRGATGADLDGVLWEPRAGEPRAAILHLHGKGGNFYSSTGRFIPELTRREPLTHLAVNMTCHDLGYTREDRYMLSAPQDAERVAGGMWERISDGRADVAAAVQVLRSLGHETVFLAGHSSGGFYAAQYAADDPEIAGRVLLSPLTSNQSAFPRWFPNDEERDTTLARARQLVAAGWGHELIPLRSWYFGVSAHSLLERASEPVDHFETALGASRTPVLMIWGSGEDRHDLWSSMYDRCTVPDKECLVLPTADHYYRGHEQSIAAALAGFVLSRSGAEEQ